MNNNNLEVISLDSLNTVTGGATLFATQSKAGSQLTGSVRDGLSVRASGNASQMVQLGRLQIGVSGGANLGGFIRIK